MFYFSVLFDVFVRCFRFTQEDRVEVYLFETEFLGWTKKMTFFQKRESHNFKIDFNNLSVKLKIKERAIVWKRYFWGYSLSKYNVRVTP